MSNQYSALPFFGQAEHRLYAVELGHVLALVEQYLAVGVVDDAFLDNGRLDDVVHLLRYDNGFPEILSEGLIQIFLVLYVLSFLTIRINT